MTHEEAIKWLKMQSSKPIKWDDYSDGSRQIREEAERRMKEAFNMAIDALKAQEPVKPNRKDAWPSPIYTCPKCGACLYHDEEGYKSKFCVECGQAVKWE